MLWQACNVAAPQMTSQAYAELEIDDAFLVLCRYPLAQLEPMSRGALDLHARQRPTFRTSPAVTAVGGSLPG